MTGYFKEVINEVKNINCMDYMASFPDKFFELAIVDPPYGIGAERGTNKGSRKKFENKAYGWDKNRPGKEYFELLFLKSQKQIIWGGNYFTDIVSPKNSWIIWDKKLRFLDFSDCEMAYVSGFNGRRGGCRVFEHNPTNPSKVEIRIHPTQKPIRLYTWILKNYASEGDKILDTHLGSGSSRIAAFNMGFDFYGCELDKEYFEASIKRFDLNISQLQIF